MADSHQDAIIHNVTAVPAECPGRQAADIRRRSQFTRVPTSGRRENSSSPLRLDTPMLQGIIEMSSRNQIIILTPFTLAGAMAPVTIAGALAQQNAEALAGIAFTQLVRPGAPVIYGNFVSSMSMQSGAPTFGTPEASLILNCGAALARRLGVPFRSAGGFTASKVSDAQAAYEAANTLQQGLMAGVNFMLHTAGWLEGGLAMGYEKFVMDCDQAAMMAVYAKGVDMSANGQALDAIDRAAARAEVAALLLKISLELLIELSPALRIRETLVRLGDQQKLRIGMLAVPLNWEPLIRVVPQGQAAVGRLDLPRVRSRPDPEDLIVVDPHSGSFIR